MSEVENIESDVQLINFGKLDEIEIEKIKKILSTGVKKIRNYSDFQLLKLNLRIHKHSTEYIHEIEGEVLIKNKKTFNSIVSDKNLYKAISEVLNKLKNEIDHSFEKENSKLIKQKRK